jgi:hypothetical protein
MLRNVVVISRIIRMYAKKTETIAFEFHAKSVLHRGRSEPNKKFWEELITYFPLYDTDRIENEAFNNSIVACIRCRGNVFIELWPSKDMDTYTYRLMGGIYEARRCDGLMCRDIHTKFNKDRFRH